MPLWIKLKVWQMMNWKVLMMSYSTKNTLIRNLVFAHFWAGKSHLPWTSKNNKLYRCHVLSKHQGKGDVCSLQPWPHLGNIWLPLNASLFDFLSRMCSEGEKTVTWKRYICAGTLELAFFIVACVRRRLTCLQGQHYFTKSALNWLSCAIRFVFFLSSLMQVNNPSWFLKDCKSLHFYLPVIWNSYPLLIPFYVFNSQLPSICVKTVLLETAAINCYNSTRSKKA